MNLKKLRNEISTINATIIQLKEIMSSTKKNKPYKKNLVKIL